MKKFLWIGLIFSLLSITILAGCGGSNNGGGVPSAPGKPTLTSADQQLTVSWTAVTRATSYQVWYGITDNGSSASQFGSDIATNNCVITGLTNGTTYYVWVKAKNSAGTSGFSPSANGIPVEPLVAPVAPEAPTLTVGNGQLSVNWIAVTGATSYQVWYGTTDIDSTASQFGNDVTTNDCVITGLTNGTAYYVWVKAKNDAGTSGFSPSANGTPIAPPATPTLTVGNGQLTVNWTAVTGATSYEVWYGTTDNSSEASRFGSDVTTTNRVITGLINGTTYYVWVKAKNSTGTSGFSPSANEVPNSLPVAPAAPTLIVGDGKLILNWTAVTGATSYQVWYGTTGNSNTASKFGSDVSTTNCIITGLTNETTYNVWVKAKNSAGTSAFSPSESGTPIPTGHQKSFTVGTVTFKMRFVSAGLTCPSDDNTINGGTGFPTSITIANSYSIAETTVTYELWSMIYNWATTTALPAYTFSYYDYGIGWRGNWGPDTGSIQQPVGRISWRDAMCWCNALTEYYYGNSANCVYYEDAAFTVPIRHVDSGNIDVTPGHMDNPYVKPDAKGFRLPTSNEWELAARYQDGTNWTPGDHVSGDTTGYCYCYPPNDAGISTVWGNYAWWDGNTTPRQSTQPVGLKLPNALGLYDMSGNVVQLCFDWHPYHPNGSRIGRGGSAVYIATYQRLGVVDFRHPYMGNTDNGFRVVKTD